MSSTLRIIKSVLIPVFVISSLISGCAAPGLGGPAKSLDLNPDYKYKIENVTIPNAEKYEIDAQRLLRTALENSLKNRNLFLDKPAQKGHYLLSVQILDYEMGNAFKRWLMPGYGSTVLAVHTDIKDSETGETIAYMEHRQSVAAGGLYSVGAWEDIFDSVANNIATDLERKHTGSGEGFFISLNPWLEKEEEGPEKRQLLNLRLIGFTDKRIEKNRIGERTAAFGVSMGDIYTNRDVAAYFTEAIQNELLASGNRLTNNPKDITVSGDVLKFWVWTDTTALYWDIIGEIEISVGAVLPGTNKSFRKIYKTSSTKRTYLYPSRELVEEVILESISKIMLDIRKDSPWTALKEGAAVVESKTKLISPVIVGKPVTQESGTTRGTIPKQEDAGRYPHPLDDKEIVAHFKRFKKLTIDEPPLDAGGLQRSKFTIQVLSGTKDGRYYTIERECKACIVLIGSGSIRIKAPNRICFDWLDVSYPPSKCMQIVQTGSNRFQLVNPGNNKRYGYTVSQSAKEVSDDGIKVETPDNVRPRPSKRIWQMPQSDVNALADCQSKVPGVKSIFDPLSGYYLFEGSDAEKFRRCLIQNHGWFALGLPDYAIGTMAPPL